MSKSVIDLKSEYEEVKASDALKKRLTKTIKKSYARKYTLRTVAVVASFLIICTTVLNVNPAFAKSLYDVPGIGAIAKILTGSRYVVSDGGFEMAVTTPKIEGLIDKELELRLNEEFKSNANSVIAAFEKDMKEIKEQYPNEEVHMGMDSNYIVKTDNDKFLALDVYITNLVGSSSTVHSFYTIDKKSGELLTLKGQFSEGVDYVTVLSNYLKQEMIRRNAEENGLFFVNSEIEETEFKSIKPDQNFYINDNNQLVICFDKYEVAAGAQGSPEFIIPKDLVK